MPIRIANVSIVYMSAVLVASMISMLYCGKRFVE